MNQALLHQKGCYMVTAPASAVKHALRSSGLVAFLVLSLLHPSSLSAVTWDFAQEGDTQGWVAWEGETSGSVIRAPLHSETAGGVWRVRPRAFAPEVNPIIELISPPLGRDSALFNRVRVRLRVLHTQPLESQIMLLWKNAAIKGHLRFPINAPPETGIDYITLLKSQRHIYTADWQEVTIDSLASKTYVRGEKVYRRVWEDDLLNDGAGRFDEQMTLAPELGEFDWFPMRLLDHVPGGRKTGLLWGGPDVGTPHDYMATYLGENGETIQEYLRVDAAADLICYAGDFDRDGDIDMVAGRAGDSMDMGPMLTGLDLLINRGDGVLDKVAWYERGYVQQDVVFSDLNEDGLLDAVFVDRDFRQPALVVNMGRKNGVPLREGHYPLQGLGGTIVDGDVDGDGDLDLVVLEDAVRGGGSGIYILSNQTKPDD